MNTLLKGIIQRLDELKRVTQFRADERTVEAAKGIVAAVFANAEQGSDLLQLEAHEGSYEVYLDRNDKYLGDLICGDDGEWRFWPGQGRGYWPAHLMRAIVAELDRLNGRTK